MNVLSLFFATAIIGVDTGWQPIVGGGYEYIIQLDSTNLEALQQGEEIVSEIPPHLRGVRRYRITFGNGPLPRIGNPRAEASTANAADHSTFRDGDWAAGAPTTPRARGAMLETSRANESPASDGSSAPNPDDDWRTRIAAPPRTDARGSTWSAGSDEEAGNKSKSLPSASTPERPFGRGSIVPPGKTPTDKTDEGTGGAWHWPNRHDGASTTSGMSDKSAFTDTPRPFLADTGAHRLAGYRGEDDSSKKNPSKGGDAGEKAQTETIPTAKESEKSWFALTATTLLLFASLGGNAYLAYVLLGMRQQFTRLVDRVRHRREPAAA